MYRSSLTLAFVVLYSAAGAASDLSSVYVAPGGIYAPSANVYVRPGPAHRPYAEPGYGYRQPSYVTDGVSIPCTGSGLWRVRIGLRRAAGLCRPRARLSRASLRSERSATTRRNTTMRRNMRRGRRCPCPTVRGHDASTTMAGRRTAIKAAVLRMGGAQRYPSPLRARDGWVSLSLYPSDALSSISAQDGWSERRRPGNCALKRK